MVGRTDATEMIEEVKDLCLQMAPVETILTKIVQLDGWPSISCQDLIISHCFGYSGSNQLCRAFPPSKLWLKHFAKKIEFCLQSYEENDSDDLFSDLLIKFIIEAKTCLVDNDDSAFISYRDIFDSKVYSTLKVLRSHNQVGTRVWEAGLFLAELLVLLKGKFRGKTIVELGAGVGVTGVIYMKSILSSIERPNRFILTDFDQVVVDNLTYNISLNFSSIIGDSKSPLICSKMLDWSTVTEKDILEINADIVLAADCTYAEDTNTHLVNCLRMFILAKQFDTCAKSVSATSSGKMVEDVIFVGAPLALVACTVRNPVTYNDFLSKLEQCPDIRWSDETEWALEVVPQPIYYYENRSQIRIIAISAAKM